MVGLSRTFITILIYQISYKFNTKLLQSLQLFIPMENPITLQEERKVWTIHQSVNGITYYYNRSTKKSQYQMPQCFKITEEDLEHPDWKQYRTAEGKKFYYNALTRKSCWHMPAEVKQWKMKMEDQKRLEKQKNGNIEEEPLSEADQIKKKFMALLKNKMVNSNTKWDSCIKLCEDDDRWNLLKMSDKKKYFLQYISELKKISELEQKAKTQANRIQFMKMLKQHKNLTSDCKMHKIQYDFITDPRWRILQGADKQNAYQDYMDQLYTKQKQAAKLQRERNIQSMKILLQQMQIKFDMKWDDFRSQFKNYQCYKKLNELDRINTFSKYILEAEQRNIANQIKQKRLKQRTNRAQFRNMLKQKLFNGDVTYKTKWRSFVKQFKEDVRLLNMMDPQSKGSSAHQIFENFMDGIKKNHKIFKSEIKSHFKKVNFKMTQQTTLSEFSSKLQDLSLYADAKSVYQQYFYHYFKQKIKSKNAAKHEKQKEKQRQKQAALKKAQKKQRKTIFKIFKQYNQNAKSKYDISEHTDKIQQNLKEQNITISRQNIFKYYLAYLEWVEGEDDRKQKQSSRSQKAKSKSKSRSSSSSRSRSRSKKKKRKQQDKERQRDRQRQNPKDKQRQRQRERQREREKQKKQSKNSLETSNIVKSITIPNQLRQMKDENEIQEEGQIKDDQVIEPQIKNVTNLKQKSISKDKQKQKQKQKQKEKEKEKGKEKQKQKKKKKSAKKRKGSSSSDSD